MLQVAFCWNSWTTLCLCDNVACYMLPKCFPCGSAPLQHHCWWSNTSSLVLTPPGILVMPIGDRWTELGLQVTLASQAEAERKVWDLEWTLNIYYHHQSLNGIFVDDKGKYNEKQYHSNNNYCSSDSKALVTTTIRSQCYALQGTYIWATVVSFLLGKKNIYIT